MNIIDLLSYLQIVSTIDICIYIVVDLKFNGNMNNYKRYT
jgi:hypothetical protein